MCIRDRCRCRSLRSVSEGLGEASTCFAHLAVGFSSPAAHWPFGQKVGASRSRMPLLSQG
eukprot:14362458-Alexandrium_andersonii.AAC.1